MKNPKRTLSKEQFDHWNVNLLMIAHALETIGEIGQALDLDEDDVDTLVKVGDILPKLKNGPPPKRRQRRK